MRKEVIEMNLDNELQENMYILIQLSKANLKISKSIVQYISQNGLNADKKLSSVHKDLADNLNELKKDIQELSKLSVQALHQYTDEELYNLKKTMSWATLSHKTKIPVSTLQYRLRRYSNSL